jgi:hypothetical protein
VSDDEEQLPRNTQPATPAVGCAGQQQGRRHSHGSNRAAQQRCSAKHYCTLGTQGSPFGMLLQSVLSPAPLLDWAPDARPEPLRVSPELGSEPHVRAFGPVWG